MEAFRIFMQYKTTWHFFWRYSVPVGLFFGGCRCWVVFELNCAFSECFEIAEIPIGPWFFGSFEDGKVEVSSLIRHCKGVYRSIGILGLLVWSLWCQFWSQWNVIFFEQAARWLCCPGWKCFTWYRKKLVPYNPVLVELRYGGNKMETQPLTVRCNSTGPSLILNALRFLLLGLSLARRSCGPRSWARTTARTASTSTEQPGEDLATF